ncbi:MAG: NAD(P)/FAD-dependent oxidoreductase, partial [Pseudonocardiaceae bacterium]
MTEQTIFDIAIVGAGPAGSVAAYAATARGMRVALIDQRGFPRDKSCGDGIGPGGARLLKRLRLDHVLADAQPIGQVSIMGPDGTEARSDVPVIDGESQHGYVVAREIFDDRLFRAALDLGAVDFSGHKLTDFTETADRRTLKLRPGGTHDGESEFELSCRLVIGADGAYSTVRRLLNVPNHPTRNTLLAMRAYADVPEDFEPRLIFEFSRDLLPLYGWIFPNGAGSV